MLEYYVAAVVAVASGAMAENPPPVREFADWFVEFMQAMHEAAVGPNGPWVAQLRDHLWVEPGGLPVRTKTFRMADRPNLQLGLMPCCLSSDLVGLPPHVADGGEGIAGLLHGIGNRRHGPQPPVCGRRW